MFCMRLMRYCFTISHVPGKNLIIADALSRESLSDVDLSDDDFNAEVETYLNTVRQTLPALEKQLMTIQHQQEGDEICQNVAGHLLQYISSRTTSSDQTLLQCL